MTRARRSASWIALVLVFGSCSKGQQGKSPTRSTSLSLECETEAQCPAASVCVDGKCAGKPGKTAHCAPSEIMCSDPAPACAEGTVASSAGSCWGECVEAEKCSELPDCSECDGPSDLCVQFPLPFGHYYVCTSREARGCEPARCGCLGAICGAGMECESVRDGVVNCVGKTAGPDGAAGAQMIGF